MDDPWRFARELWDEHFQPLRDDGYQLERVEVPAYWTLHETELRGHFPPEAFINVGALRTERSRDAQRVLAQAAAGQELIDCAVVRDGDEVAAMFCGELKSPEAYRMWHTNVHADYRRRGIYRRILAGTIAYTSALGCDRITSEHAMCNNPVLIAKLAGGFRILGMDVEPMVGPSVRLAYFHNTDHLAAYEFRCGLATMNERLLRHGSGAMDQLIAQFRADPIGSD